MDFLSTFDMRGSFQNPAFSPDGEQLSFTLWGGGYNRGEPNVYTVPLQGNFQPLLAARHAVSQPGSCWSKDGLILSSGDPDTIIQARDGVIEHLTSGLAAHDLMGYEPSWGPNGWFAFECHKIDQEGFGRIATCHAGDKWTFWTNGRRDCRQPNWSPDGQTIVFQEQVGKNLKTWRLKLLWPYQNRPEDTCRIDGDATDATWWPDSSSLIFSNQEGALCRYMLGSETVHPILAEDDRYCGAPSVSPDGRRIAFETRLGDPDGSDGTRIAFIGA